jgi:hypothetical protein
MVARGQQFDHVIVNVRSGQTIHLPELVLLDVRQQQCRFLIRACTLSDYPSVGEGCMVANIGTVLFPCIHAGQGVVSFNFLGAHISGSTICGDFEDVIFHNGLFYTINRDGHMFVSLPTPELIDSLPSIRCYHLSVISQSPPGKEDGHLVGRYLVSSRGQIIMLSRYSEEIGGLTSSFLVHVMVHKEPAGSIGGMFMWQPVNDLGGRSIFLGRGCSRSFETFQNHGVEGVYFLDDRSFNYWMMMQHGASEGSGYPINDNGCWSFKTRTISRFPCQAENSNYSSPVWIVHCGSLIV